MIPLNSSALYEESLRLLSNYVGHSYPGRLVQIWLAARRGGDGIPLVGAGPGLSTGDLEVALDSLYRKADRAAAGEPCIVSLFRNEHLVPTGQIGAGLTHPSNIWRNNFQLQKAMICYASPEELANPAFLMQSRAICPHLILPAGVPAGSLRGGYCELKPGTLYRGEDRAKFMRRDPETKAVSIVDPNNIGLWQNAVVPDAGRLPVAALICALYFDSAISGGRIEVDVPDFMVDFAFTPAQFAEFFEDDPEHPVHVAMRGVVPALAWTRAAAAAPPVVDEQRPPNPIAVAAAPAVQRQRRRRVGLADLPALAPPIAPPAGGHWWAAEQAVQKAFRDAGWMVIDRSRQGVGFDFEARLAGNTWYVEVKSSAATCSPVLTEREHEAACDHGQRYVLAIVENYNPEAAVRILWVRNPAAIGMAPRNVVEFPLPRSRWLPRADLELF